MCMFNGKMHVRVYQPGEKAPLAYRALGVSSGTDRYGGPLEPGVFSLFHSHKWETPIGRNAVPPGEGDHAKENGFYAMRSIADLADYEPIWHSAEWAIVHADVEMAGLVIEYDEHGGFSRWGGYRAQEMRVVRLYIPINSMWVADAIARLPGGWADVPVGYA